MHSPRSTFGTTRQSAYWNSSRGAGTLGLLGEVARLGHPAPQVLDVGFALAVAVEALRRDGLARRAQHVVGGARRQALVGLRDRPGVREQNVLRDRRERPAGLLGQVALLVLQVERRA